ncbi:MAG: hypothetical protein HQL06_09490 [Nitrospirae bacterium]|nr:hypothetical protein [Nitrospirota bacterium]
MRKSNLLFAFLLAGAALFGLMFLHSSYMKGAYEDEMREKIAMTQRYGLTDLCLFTEARYTRHPSQADLYTAFQDNPFSFEHFPSGSIISPPEVLKIAYKKLAAKK